MIHLNTSRDELLREADRSDDPLVKALADELHNLDDRLRSLIDRLNNASNYGQVQDALEGYDG